MAAGGKDAHVGADLSHDHLGVAPADAGDRLEQAERRRERGDLLLDPGRAGADRLVQVVEMGEDFPRTCFKLTSAEGVMWSIGAQDLMKFDGKAWSRVE